MPVVTIEGYGPCTVEAGVRLVRAIESCGVDIGHRCGGFARCTTCRVRFHDGEPEKMTRAEYEKLKSAGLLGEVRLACQIVVDRDMHVEPLMRVSEMGWSDPGPEPAPGVEPEAVWFDRDTLET
ncbi:(2Fe-2S)-binding protein [Rhodocaloribacter litoris]|uniref:2Fe-2S iron-sulfur cluster-binding protein n=1 Tax=Rhodocaloribacter litoris TaxID=2558931 RepID=UPI0014216751|nr:2Fe-2S iron-sulfur cluster-binding protein [Rhodocaloribacter litoris]QXD14891.1 (2Fe-2S)-binding protein [Rhodocaloribacter litoris]